MKDPFDQKILQTLAVDGRISVTDLASAIGLSHSATLKRLRALEEDGTISGYRAIFDNAKLGGNLRVFTTVSLSAQTRAELSEFEALVYSIPEITDCYLMTGSSDYMLKIVVDSLSDFEHILTEKLTRFQGTTGIRSSIVLRSVVEQRPPLSVSKKV